MAASRHVVGRGVLIACILGVMLLLFAWVAGFLAPGRLSGGTVADAMQAANGRVFSGFRRAHAKGLCVAGEFDSNGAGVSVSDATLFSKGAVPVIGRFSTGGGDPMAADGRVVFHALGLRFSLPGGEEWRMAVDHTPIFIVSNLDDFVALEKASVPSPQTGKPDPVRLNGFIATHPETRAFLNYMKTAPLPSSFANGTYYSINAFRFIDHAGRVQSVRWQFEPETTVMSLDKTTLPKQSPNFLFDDLFDQIRHAPLRWHLIIVLANPGDRTDNATIRWTGTHRRIDVGTLVLNQASTEEQGQCRDYNFDPLILPDGVERSDDPLLPARSAVYSASFRRRAIEGPQPDAMTLAKSMHANAIGTDAGGTGSKGGVR